MEKDTPLYEKRDLQRLKALLEKIDAMVVARDEIGKFVRYRVEKLLQVCVGEGLYEGNFVEA